jgi:hypothetical protein
VWYAIGTDGDDGTITWGDFIDTGRPYSEIENILEFTNVADGLYYIQASTCYVYQDQNIFCVDDEGNGAVDGVDNISVQSRPARWYWDKYPTQSGRDRELCSDAYVPTNGNELRPIKAGTWNRFTNQINRVRVYEGLDKFDFTLVYGPSNYNPETCPFTPEIYNEAAEAINDMGGNVDKIDSYTPLSAKLFEDLRDELNDIIDALD